VTDPSPAPSPAPQRSLAHLPVGAFTSVMGIGGLAIGLHGASERWGLSPWIGWGVAFLGLATFVVVAVAYLTKANMFRVALATEWKHPIQAAFVPTISISLLVLSIAFYSWSPLLSAILWWPGAAGQAVLTLMTVRTWISHDAIEAAHPHPGWFIPAVGNLVVPLVGVHHAPATVAWYFFGVGFLYWIALLPVVLVRLFTAGSLPPRLMPTLAIFVAPPSLAALSWVALGGSWLDPFSRIMMGVLVFQLLLLAAQYPVLRKTPFAITAWGFAFPLAAATSAVFGSTNRGGVDYTWLAAALLAITTVVVAVVGVRTTIAVAKGKICLPH
jgi:tellurite resistance protein